MQVAVDKDKCLLLWHAPPLKYIVYDPVWNIVSQGKLKSGWKWTGTVTAANASLTAWNIVVAPSDNPTESSLKLLGKYVKGCIK